jgi:RecB family exonuclease
VTAVEELFEPEALAACKHIEERLDPIPPADRVHSPADARLFGMSELLSGRPELFAGLCASADYAAAAQGALAAALMNARRFQSKGFTEFEGRLTNARNVSLTARQFDSQREFSATQLEEYARCPFRFFVANVLGVEPLREVEAGTDLAGRGTLVHFVLAELHRQVAGALTSGAEAARLPRGDAIAALFRQTLETYRAGLPPESGLAAALREVEYRVLDEWASAYGHQWDEYLSRLEGVAPIPLHFEVPFGSGEGQAPHLSVGTGEGAVRVGGRIDRIDITTAGRGAGFLVIDYKTGHEHRTSLEMVADGTALQLALYALAISRLGLAQGRTIPALIGYWHVKGSGFAPAFVRRKKANGPLPMLDADDWQQVAQALEVVIPRQAGAMRRGEFPVQNADGKCTSHCPYSQICRVNQIRSLPPELGKNWEP